MKKVLLSAAVMLLIIPAVFNKNDISAQTVSVEVGSEKEEKKQADTREKHDLVLVYLKGIVAWL